MKMTVDQRNKSLIGMVEQARRAFKKRSRHARLSQYLLLLAAIAAVLAIVLSEGERFLPVIREAFQAIMNGF